VKNVEGNNDKDTQYVHVFRGRGGRMSQAKTPIEFAAEVVKKWRKDGRSMDRKNSNAKRDLNFQKGEFEVNECKV